MVVVPIDARLSHHDAEHPFERVIPKGYSCSSPFSTACHEIGSPSNNNSSF